MFDFILKPIGLLLRLFNKIVGNQYIVSLLIFAIIIEILMLPFAIKQQKNSIKQAKLRPKEMAIRKKYAGREDQPTKQKMQAEIQELYQKEGFNPMGGCLPLLIQFPILIMLYNIVINPLKYVCGLSESSIGQVCNVVNSIEGTSFTPGNNTIGLMSRVKNIMSTDPHAFDGISGFSDKIKNLPNLTYGRVNLGLNPSINPEEKIQYVLLLIPVLTFVVYFFSAKITRKLSYQPVGADSQMGCSNKVMDIVLPAFSVYITFITPAAVGIYWIFKSILGVAKQYIMKKTMPIPVFTDEDYKAAEKEMGTHTEKAKQNNAKSGKVVRSLHHIDDEDYDDTREEALRRKKILEEQAAKEKAEAEEAAAKSTILGGATVKKDDRPDRSKKKDAASEEKIDIVLEVEPEETDSDDKNDDK